MVILHEMKLELLTNATVVDDVIRFVASNTAAPKTTEKANSNYIFTLDEDSNDIQGPELWIIRRPSI